MGPLISFDRGGLELEAFPLVDCLGKPLERAREVLSVLARPWGSERPKSVKRRGGSGDEIAPNVRLLDPGLLQRLNEIAKRFPGRTLSLVSGYRPEGRGESHPQGRAVDLRIAGVEAHEVATACRRLADTGCGFYPNSSFVHVDARARGEGKVSWIDASGAGETPRYVTKWPPDPSDTVMLSSFVAQDENEIIEAETRQKKKQQRRRAR